MYEQQIRPLKQLTIKNRSRILHLYEACILIHEELSIIIEQLYKERALYEMGTREYNHVDATILAFQEWRKDNVARKDSLVI